VIVIVSLVISYQKLLFVASIVINIVFCDDEDLICVECLLSNLKKKLKNKNKSCDNSILDKIIEKEFEYNDPNIEGLFLNEYQKKNIFLKQK